MGLFNVAEHAVEIEVEHLQEEVGGDEAREIVVVVFLIDVEQLVFVVGHYGETVSGECVVELRVYFLELVVVYYITGIDDEIGISSVEIGLLQLFLPLQELLHEGLFLRSVFEREVE